MDRREAMGFLAGLGVAAAIPCASLAGPTLARSIPASGEKVPPIGLGTWIPFDVTDGAERRVRYSPRVRYIGVTTSHGRRHDLAARIMRTEKLDFVQFTYNVNDRDAEPLFAVAADRGIAVIVNRPFDGGSLFGAKTAKPLPGWANVRALKGPLPGAALRKRIAEDYARA